MTLEDGLYAHVALTTAPAGSALAAVQTQLADTDPIVIRRLWAIQLTQRVDRWPALTYQRIGDGRRVWSHGGPNGLVETRLQLDARARDTPTARGDTLTEGLAVAVSDDATVTVTQGAEVFTQVAEVMGDISINQSMDEVEVTSHSSPDRSREYLPTLINRDASFSVN